MYRPDLQIVNDEIDFKYSSIKRTFGCSWRKESFEDFKMNSYRYNTTNLFENYNMAWRQKWFPNELNTT